MSSPSLDRSGFNAMISGQLYSASDPYIRQVATAQAAKSRAINEERDDAVRDRLLREFYDVQEGCNFYVVAPTFCEYGFNTSIGTNSGIGPNCTLSDVCPIKIGSRTLIACSVSLITATHPLSPEERNGSLGKEYAKPITIGNDCWIGAGAIILPGVTLGDGVVVGAGSVVTKDVEGRCVVVGNPARVIKRV